NQRDAARRSDPVGGGDDRPRHGIDPSAENLEDARQVHDAPPDRTSPTPGMAGRASISFRHDRMRNGSSPSSIRITASAALLPPLSKPMRTVTRVALLPSPVATFCASPNIVI